MNDEAKQRMLKLLSALQGCDEHKRKLIKKWESVLLFYGSIDDDLKHITSHVDAVPEQDHERVASLLEVVEVCYLHKSVKPRQIKYCVRMTRVLGEAYLE